MVTELLASVPNSVMQLMAPNALALSSYIVTLTLQLVVRDDDTTSYASGVVDSEIMEEAMSTTTSVIPF